MVLDTVKKAADAYIVFRLGEITKRPVVLRPWKIQDQQGQRLGVIAQSLGIKPGSKEFHALKTAAIFTTTAVKARRRGRRRAKEEKRQREREIIEQGD